MEDLNKIIAGEPEEEIQCRTFYLPAIDKTVTVGQYVKAVKLAKSNPLRMFKYGLMCWWPCTGAEIMKQFYRGLTERINQAIPYYKRGVSRWKK